MKSVRCYDHIDLRVRNLAEASFFYQTLLPTLGFDRDAKIEGWIQFEDSSGQSPGAFFGVTEPKNHIANECRIAFWASSVEEVDKLAKVVLAAGGRNVEGPAYENRGYYAVFFEDPSGNCFEICHRTLEQSP
jgi:predicted enzyme related to lactoylglutathione lyase